MMAGRKPRRAEKGRSSNSPASRTGATPKRKPFVAAWRWPLAIAGIGLIALPVIYFTEDADSANQPTVGVLVPPLSETASAGEPVGAVRPFLDEQGITYPVWVDPRGTEPPGNATLSLFTALGGIGLPTTYFVDAAGRIADVHLGEIDRLTLEAKADHLLQSSSDNLMTSQPD